MSDENVVMLPLAGSEPASLEQVRERVDSIREAFIESSVEALVESALSGLAAAGFEFGDDEIEDVLLFQESLRSMMHRTRGLHHPLQGTARELFTVDYDSGTAIFNPQPKRDGTATE